VEMIMEIKDMQDINRKLSNVNYNKESRGEINITPNVMHTVSPYSNKFDEVLEKNIITLVKTLTDKGWLTVSSCDGHTGKKVWYLTVCVNSKEDYKLFNKFISHEHLWYTQKYFVPTLIDVDADLGNNFKYVKPQPKKVTEYLNSIFMRNYSEWYVFAMYLNFQENLDTEFVDNGDFLYYIKKKFWYWTKFKKTLSSIENQASELPYYDK
jgi:hypothetical protein